MRRADVLSGFNKGYYLEPTILTDVPLDSDAWREEIFGPVVCVRPFCRRGRRLSELANDFRFGLAAAVMSADEASCRTRGRRLPRRDCLDQLLAADLHRGAVGRLQAIRASVANSAGGASTTILRPSRSLVSRAMSRGDGTSSEMERSDELGQIDQTCSRSIARARSAR